MHVNAWAKMLIKVMLKETEGVKKAYSVVSWYSHRQPLK